MKVKLEVTLDFDPEKNSVQVLSCIPIVSDSTMFHAVHELSSTQIKFGILTLGKTFGKVIPKEEEITLYWEETPVGCFRSHRQVGGRIDGLTAFYREHEDVLVPETKLLVKFDGIKKALYLSLAGQAEDELTAQE